MNVPPSETGSIDVGKLFTPQRIAVVGASPDRHYSRSIIGNLRLHGFPDEGILPVNPRYESVDGLACRPSIADLATLPDAAALLVGKAQATPLLTSAAEAGVGAALVIADGYAEESAQGLAEQHGLGAIARDAGMALLGPNTLGFVVPATGAALWCAGILPARLVEGPLAILAQSSGMLNLIMGLAGHRRLGVRACVSVGNAETIGLPELVSHFAADADTGVLGLVVESIDRPQALVDALVLARAAGKPVVVLKIGVSDLGRQNSVAHTGRMAGPEQGWSALFDRLGICVTRDLDDFIETLTLFGGVVGRLPEQVLTSGRLGLAVATISGGETSLICDVAAQEELTLATLQPDTLADLRGALGKATMIGNPLDLQNTRTSRPEVFWRGIDSLCADPAVDVLAVRFNMSVKPTPALQSLYRDVVRRAVDHGVVPLVLTRAYEFLDLEWWRIFAELDVPFVLSYRNALRAFASLSRWLADRLRQVERPGAVPETAGRDRGPAAELDADALRAWLDRAGVPFVRSATVDDPQAAVRVAEELGWPVVLKAVAPGLVHKSEVGGVVVGLEDPASLDAAAKSMTVSVSEALGLSPVDIRFEVQQMVTEGHEVIVGMVPDPTWGPVIMLGAGGIHAETTGDVVWDLPPISPERTVDLVRRLRIGPVLEGSRNQPRADIEALAEVVSAFSRTVAAEGDHLAAVDLNPVLVAREGLGVRAVDAAVLQFTSDADK